MIVAFDLEFGDVADAIADAEYEEILALFERVDELIMDSVFTDMVFSAFDKRKHGIENV